MPQVLSPPVQVEVVYIADVSDWLEEAKEFVAKAAKLPWMSKASGKVTNGFENLGIASLGLGQFTEAESATTFIMRSFVPKIEPRLERNRCRFSRPFARVFAFR